MVVLWATSQLAILAAAEDFILSNYFLLFISFMPIEALRYECREPGARISSSNRIHVEIESIRAETKYETAIGRSAIKSILKLVDEVGAMHRKRHNCSI